MHRLHVIVVAVLIAAAAVLGTEAALRTTSLGTAHRASADAVVRARAKQLDRFEAALRRQLAQRTPALPAVPKRVPAPAQRVVYHRPPAVVVVTHSSHHEDDEGGREGGGDD